MNELYALNMREPEMKVLLTASAPQYLTLHIPTKDVKAFIEGVSIEEAQRKVETFMKAWMKMSHDFHNPKS